MTHCTKILCLVKKKVVQISPTGPPRSGPHVSRTPIKISKKHLQTGDQAGQAGPGCPVSPTPSHATHKAPFSTNRRSNVGSRRDLSRCRLSKCFYRLCCRRLRPNRPNRLCLNGTNMNDFPIRFTLIRFRFGLNRNNETGPSS